MLHNQLNLTFFREEKATRNQGGETPNSNAAKCCMVQVTGANITEEVIRRRLTTFEPFTYVQEDDEK